MSTFSTANPDTVIIQSTSGTGFGYLRQWHRNLRTEKMTVTQSWGHCREARWVPISGTTHRTWGMHATPHGGSKVRLPAAVGAVLLASALIASCSSSATPSTTTKPSSGSSSTASTASGSAAPGVTPTQISVGSIATLTGAIAADFDAFAPGIQAYFDTVNASGGVNGRKIVLTANLDDGGSPPSPSCPTP